MKKSLLFLSLIASISAANAQWTSQATGFSAASRGLNQITALDANTVWALAYDGSGGGANVQEFTKTTDGGASWTPGTVEMGDPLLEINNISPVNGTTAWVSALIPADGNGFIYKTSDGGIVWDQQLSEGFVTSGSSFLNGVYFWNSLVGVAYGDPTGAGNGEFEIWRTTDGGDTWTQVPGASITDPLSGEYGYNSTPVAAGGTLWFPTNKGRLFRTSDMGLTWTGSQVTGLADFSGVSATTGNGTTGNVFFSNANNGYLLKTAIGGTTTTHTYTRTYQTTTNAGATWSASSPFTGTRTILNYIPGTTTMVATSQGGQNTTSGTSVSTNNGATWTDVESAAQRGTTAFIDINTGWSAGFSTSEIEDGIFKLTGQLGVDNAQPVAKFTVYPNPASSVVTISTPDVESSKVSITDISGKVVMTRSLNGIENTVDISSLSTGAYFFEISASSKKEVVKIIKN